jgi:hypothetical protein
MGRRRLAGYLGVLGLKLVVDVLEGAAKVGELLPGLLGDEHLSHPWPPQSIALPALAARSVTFLTPLIFGSARISFSSPGHLSLQPPPPPPLRFLLRSTTSD